MTQNQSQSLIALLDGQIAQSVEQRIENPCVPGSIPGLATMNPLVNTIKFFAKFLHPINIYDSIYDSIMIQSLTNLITYHIMHIYYTIGEHFI